MKPLTFVKVKEFLVGEVQRDSAYLIPLRLFIGVGWMRASLEKLIEPGWLDGSALRAFFEGQISGGQVAFPFYEALMQGAFQTQAQTLSWLIIAGQLLVGMAVLAGFFTNFALLCGMFMNFNFIYAGEINPSAFYIVIQMALFIGNTGAIIGIDQSLSRRIPLCFLVAQPPGSSNCLRVERATFAAMGLLALVAALVAFPYIRDYGPHSVEDPAMILLVLATVIGLSAAIMLLRLQEKMIS